MVLVAVSCVSVAFLFLTLSDASVTELSIPPLGKIEARDSIAFIDSEGQLGTISPDGSDLRMMTATVGQSGAQAGKHVWSELDAGEFDA